MVDAKPNEVFLGLVMSLQMSAWMQLGKVMNPMTGKIERDVQHAKDSIDLLGMLEEKTRGNLHPEEAQLLTRALFELRMNYVEEVEKDRAPAAGSGAPEAGSGEPAPGGAG